MAYTTINKSTNYFDIRTYSASGAGSISNLNFQPDFIWFKNRTITGDHGLLDAVRGVTKYLISNSNSTGLTGNGTSQDFLSFDTNGYTYGTSSQLDCGTGTPVTWNWKANGAGSANTDGSINSTVSANTTAGFSIVKYSGNSGGNGYSATIGHGLGVAPSMVIVKCITNSDGWFIYHKGNTSAPQTDFIRLDNTDATADLAGMWYDTAPTSSVFTVGTDGGVNQVGRDYIAYCFAEKTGYSKFGSYSGNGSNDGPMIFCGFKPAWVMVKRTDASSFNWYINDSVRKTFNTNSTSLFANTTGAESADGMYLDMLSNGFKIRETGNAVNNSSGSYIYLAFGQSLVGSNNVPCTAF